jgi:hypothetical protein
MSFIFGLLLFAANVYLVIFFLLRAVTLPSVLLVVSPTALARRFVRRGSDGKSSVDIDVDVRNLSDRLMTPQILVLTASVAIAGFAFSQNIAYLWIAGAMLVTLFAEQDKMDERTFEIWTRALAAVSDAVIVGVLFFVTIFRLQVDAFGLLTFMFFARELLLFFARRWLESEPEFEQYSGGKTGKGTKIGLFGGEDELEIIGNHDEPDNLEVAKKPDASKSSAE